MAKHEGRQAGRDRVENQARELTAVTCAGLPGTLWATEGAQQQLTPAARGLGEGEQAFELLPFDALALVGRIGLGDHLAHRHDV